MITEERIFKDLFIQNESAFWIKAYEELTEEDKKMLAGTLSYQLYQAGVHLKEAADKIKDIIKSKLYGN